MSDQVAPTAGTLACGGLPGVQKPGLDTIITVGGYAADAAITLATDGLASIFLSALVSGIQWDLGEICPRGDPGEVTLTLADYTAAMSPQDPVAMNTALLKIHQWFAHLMWPSWCDCQDGSAPPPNVVSSPPPAGNNQGVPTGTTGEPCWNVTQALTILVPNITTDRTPILLPYENVVAITPGGIGWPTHAGVIPAGVTAYTTHCTMQGAAPQGSTGLFGQIYDSTGTVIRNDTWQDFNGSTDRDVTRTFQLPTSAHSWSVFSDSNASSPQQDLVNVQFACTTTTGPTLTTPCCPPDPNLDIRLRSIQDMLMYVMTHLRAGSSGHTQGTVHAGLTGNGTITLVAAVDAIRVNVRTDLTSWPDHPGSPNYYLSMGFITSIAAGSPLKGWRLVYGSQTFPIVTYADQIGYTLPAGITIDIVELLGN